MIEINTKTSLIKPIYAGFLAMLDYCVSVIIPPVFLLFDNCFIVSECNGSYAYSEGADGNEIYQGNNFKEGIAPIWISIGQDPASEIHLIGIHLNHAACDSCDDFINVGFEDDLCW